MSASQTAVRAGRAFVELFTDDSKMRRGLAMASRRFKAWGASLTASGAKVMAAGGVILTPLLGAVGKFMAAGDDLHKMAARTGASTKFLSEIGFAAEQSGSSLETVEKGLKGMQRQLLNAERGSKAAVDTLDDLGVTLDQLKGLSPEDQFTTIVEALSRVEDPGRRAALSMQLFGRAGQELLPLIEGGAAGMAAMRKEAEGLGLAITQDQADDAAALADAWNRAKRAAGGAVFTVGSSLAGALTDSLDVVTRWIVAAAAWVRDNKDLVVTIAAVAAGVVVAGGVLFTLGIAATMAGMALAGLSTLLGLIAAVLGAILSPAGLVVAALLGIGAGFLYLTDTGQQVLGWLGQRFTELKTFAVETFQGIADALMAGDLALAGRIMWAALKVAWYEGTGALGKAWDTFVKGLLGNTGQGGFAEPIIETWYGLQAIWVEITSSMSAAWAKFSNTATDKWKGAQLSITEGLTRILGKINGLSDEAVEASLKVDRRNFAADKKERDAALATTLSGINANKNDRLASIGAARSDAIKELDADATRKERARQKRLDAANKELTDARREAAKARDERSKKLSGSGSPFERAGLEFAGPGGPGGSGASTAGTFGGTALWGLGGSGGVLREIATNTKETADAVKKQEKSPGETPDPRDKWQPSQWGRLEE